MSATRVAHRTSPSTSLVDSSSMHMTIQVTYLVDVNSTLRGNFELSFSLARPASRNSRGWPLVQPGASCNCVGPSTPCQLRYRSIWPIRLDSYQKNPSGGKHSMYDCRRSALSVGSHFLLYDDDSRECRTTSRLERTLLSNDNALVGRNESRVPHSWPPSCVGHIRRSYVYVFKSWEPNFIMSSLLRLMRFALWYDISYKGQKQVL
jgi:hypothetical protein